MKNLATLSFFILFSVSAYAQKIHNSAEILKILADSKLSYSINVLEKQIECEDYSNKLNLNQYYRVKNESSLLTKELQPNDKSKLLFEKAEGFFTSKNYDSALTYYQLSLRADTTFYKAMTYIGQMYEVRGELTNAIEWFKKAISRNYIDYMAHWFLADAYLAMNDVKNATDEIVIAQILNRNNPRIKESLKRIFEKGNRQTEDWCFNPQYKLEKVSDTKINVTANMPWLGFAMAKAVWNYEPGYKKSMGVEEGVYSTIEDKECIVSLIPIIENDKEKSKLPPELKILKDVILNKHTDDYILYEIVLPKDPFIAYQLSEEQILKIREYILNHRNPVLK